MNEFEYSKLNSLLFDAVVEGENFQAIINQVAYAYPLKVSVINANGDILFCPINVALDKFPPVSPPHYFQLLKNEPVCVDVENEKIMRYIYPIIPTTISSFFVVDTEKKREDSCCDLVIGALRTVYAYFFKEGEGLSGLDTYKTIITRYLFNDEYDNNLDDFFNSSQISFGMVSLPVTGNYAVVVIYPGEDCTLNANCLTTFSRYIPNSLPVIDNNRLLAILYNLKQDKIGQNDELCSTLNEYCESQNMTAIVSSVFEQISDRFTYIRQATCLTTQKTRDCSRKLWLAEDQFFKSILAGAVAKMGKEFFLLSGIERLAQYDKDNNTKYLDTLETYFMCAKHYTETAKQLYVDRATLKYRLNKIKDLLLCDIEDASCAQRLMLAITIHKMI